MMSSVLCAQTYASAYTGHARLARMLFIADHAPTTQMQLEALKIAAEEARQVWRVLSLVSHMIRSLPGKSWMPSHSGIAVSLATGVF